MASTTFLAKLYDEFLKSDSADPRADAFIAWAEKWLQDHPPAGTGFADGSSAVTIRFQDGAQYPLFVVTEEASSAGRSFSITGQPDKVNKGGIVQSNAVPITGR
jgi:hypothetical protein